MPLWAVIAIVAGVLLIIGAGVAAFWFGRKELTRRALLRLVVRAEAVEAAEQALEESIKRLAIAGDTELEQFADDPESVERRTMEEVASRARLLTDELDRMAVPKGLVHVAEALADAAYLVSQEAERVRVDDIGPLAFDKLASIDLKLVRRYAEKARLRVIDACDVCGLEDTAVYGGGLYL